MGGARVRQQPNNETAGLRPEDDAQPPYLYRQLGFEEAIAYAPEKAWDG
jgi:hypothetical protein